ncbi:MAG TPA: phosphoribosyl-ATP diphosphatase [Bdellovibrionota bacterium]|nr:phosphoribosyl-ATP diphosphatase [Bdellovibrionota bacterium]
MILKLRSSLCLCDLKVTDELPKEIGKKVIEEAEEFAEALEGNNPLHITHEATDLWFHFMVGLVLKDIPFDKIFQEFNRRFGTSGHTEKLLREEQPR